MFWPGEVKLKLQELTGDTPPAYRKYVDQYAHAAAENAAKKLGKSEVDEDAMVRGYILSVPRHLRDGIHEILTEHNVDLMYYRPVFDEPNASLHTTVPFDQIDHHGATS